MGRLGQLLFVLGVWGGFWSAAAFEARGEESWSSIFSSTFQNLVSDNSNRTLGGTQLWTDEYVFRAWRIQRSALTGQYRVLDGDDRQYLAGTYDECHKYLENRRREFALQPVRGRVVVLVHGMTGQRSDLAGVGTYLTDNIDATIVQFGYASTRGTLEDHAAALAKVIERLDTGVDQIDIVAYSMGNLVVRRYLYDHQDPRIKRLVMIGPPNHGAKLAADWGENPVFLAVVGASAYQMGAGWETTVKSLAQPTCEFGIIAGCKGNDSGYSAKLAGDDDILLSVSTTRLAGARDFKQIEGVHHLLPRQQICREYVLRFLQQGYFVSAEKREPITAED